MKISDVRCGWTVEGKYIATLVAGERPSDDELVSYYGVKPGEKNYHIYAAPAKYDRVVILKDNGHFVIAPMNPDIMKAEE